jgi:2-amino-4-hydroxy-6-hydroxymethyldihydropteridine diphosphokinase
MKSIGPFTSRCVAIGMGSNLGDSWTILRQACVALNDLPNTRLEGVSRVRLTQPIIPESEGEEPTFLNAVALLRTSLSPVSLLKELMTVEASFGRVRMHRWMPRTLDLDILLDEAGPFCNEDLYIPHPRLGSRLFFLACLEELLPNWRHPWCNLTVQEMIEVLSARPGYFLVVSETFAQAHRPDTMPDEGGKSGDDIAAAPWTPLFAP